MALVLAVSLAAPVLASAAPPTLTYLYPAGAQRGTTVEVTAGGTFERWPVQAWVDAKGLEVKPARDKGKLSITVAADATPGTCLLRLFDAEGATALRPFIVGTLPEALEMEPNDDAKKPQMIERPAVVMNGRLEKAGDVDCFGLKLRKGQTLVASLEANRNLGSPMDGLLQILSADGFVLEQNNDYHGLDPQIVYSVPKDGTYVVRTFAFPSMPDASIRFAGGENYVYRLTLTTEGFADHPWPLAVTNAEAGSVELVGWNIPEGARKVAIPRGDSAESAAVFNDQVGNSLRIRLEPHATALRDNGNDRQHAQAISLPITISGRLERPDEVHAYSFEAKKGQKLLFQAEAQALGFPLTVVLRVVDASGKQLAQAEGPALGRDPELVFDAPQDGKYSIEVRDLHGAASLRHVYRLRTLMAEPDFTLSVAADRLVAIPGMPLDIPVTVERRNGFSDEVELSAEGLPEGTTAPAVPVPAGAKMVKLHLTATTTATVPLRIVGKRKGKEGPVRSATATLGDLNVATPHLWLTVPTLPEKK